MVTMTLSEEDASFLLEEIGQRAKAVENELVHTDARDMQRDLAAELDRLQGLRRELGRVNGRTFDRTG